jgi:hypothetical protein
MRKYVLSIAVKLFVFLSSSAYRNKNKTANETTFVQMLTKYKLDTSTIPIDSPAVPVFLKKYPNLKKYQSDVKALYRKRNYNSIWFDKNGLIEFANLLYSKVNQLENKV